MEKVVPSLRFLLVILILTFSWTGAYSQTTLTPELSVRKSLSPTWLGFNGQNTIRNGQSWTEQNLVAKVPLLKPKILRYPAGGIGNWWDWRRGWFVNSPDLPSNYAVLPQQNNTLENYKVVADAAGAATLFMLNMVSSNLQEQLAMLHHADSIGIPVQLVELGNEFFISADDEDAGEGAVYVDSMFTYVKTYADMANIWIDSIHAHFPNAKVGVQGCFEKNLKPKRVKWNDSLKYYLNGREDAWSFHTYWGTSWNDTTETEADKLVQTEDEFPNWFYQPYKMWKVLKDKSLPDVPPGKDMWNTEYNMTEHTRPVHGLWGHGLYLPLQTMQFLNEERFKLLTTHAMVGSALYGQYFFVTNGFYFGGEEGDWVQPPTQPTTTYYGLTATGNTMKMLGEATVAKTYASPLVFPNCPQVTTSEDYGLNSYNYDGVYGWLFHNTTGSDAIIINLTGTAHTINTSFFAGGGTYTQKHAAILTPIAKSDDVTVLTGSLPANLTLQPYSFTKITSSFVPAAPPTVNITVNGSTTICADKTTQLDAGAGYVRYVWSTGETTRTITVNQTGDYWVRGYTATGGYYAADTVHIHVNPNPNRPNIIPQGSRFFCEGQSLIMDLQIVNPPAGLTYQWNNGATTSTITATLNGNYWVTITDLNGCTSVSDTEVITVYPLPHPTITAGGPTSFCYDQNVVLSAPAGYTLYSWSPGGFGQTRTVTQSGTYSVIVTDANGCSGTSSNSIPVTVYDLPTPTVNVVGGGTTYCSGAPVYLTTQSGYTYQWSQNLVNISGATNINYTPTAGGPYRVTTTESHGCSRMSLPTNITINPLPTPNINVTGGTSICIGQTTQLSSHISYASYLWSTGATTSSITVANSGTYTLTVTDANGCVGTSAPKTITVNALPTPSITAAGPTEFCSGSSVTLTVTQPYSSYSWSNGTVGQSKSFSATGTYYCTVTDANGCSGSSNSISVNVHDVPLPIVTTSNGLLAWCAGSGAYLTTTTTGYNYQWQLGGGNITGGTNQTWTPVATGSYRLQLTDNIGCTKRSDAISITVNPLPVPNITVTGGTSICAGQSTTLSSSGTYSSYLWSTGATTSSINVTTAGTYYLTVTDGNGCVGTSAGKVITVNSNPVPTISAQGSTDICSGTSVTLAVNQTYSSYLWSNGTVGQSKSMNATGTYFCTVTDANGCTGISNSIGVVVHSVPTPTAVTSTGQTTFCSNAGVYLTTSTTGYAYQWLKAGVDITGATSQNYIPTQNGGYKVRLTDQWGCTATSGTLTLTVLGSPAPSINITAGNSVICNGQTATLSADANYTTYLWSNGATTKTTTVSSAGTYTLTVTNSTGCSATATPMSITNTIQNVTVNASGPTTFCTGGNVVLSTGTTYSSYNWSNGATTQSITVTNSGTYTCNVTNSSGCTGVSNAIAVSVGSALSPSIVVNGNTTLCGGQSSTLSANATYSTYLWSTGATTSSITVSTAGTYVLTVTNGTGCSGVSAPVVISVGTIPNVNITASGATQFCPGGNVNLSTANPYSAYLWSNGATTQSTTISSSGTYSCQVTDAFGCTGVSNSITVSVQSLPTPTVSSSGPSTFCANSGPYLTTLPGYFYQWRKDGNDIINATSQNFTPTQSGNYSVRISDVTGCSATSSSFFVTVHPAPTAGININGSTSLCGGSTVTLSSNADYTAYLWSTGATTASIVVGTPATYTLTVTNSNGCTGASAPVVVSAGSGLPVNISAASATQFCTGGSVVLSTTSPFHSYTWSNGATTQSITVTTSGTYSCTVTDISGCSGTSNAIAVTVGPLAIPTVNTSTGATAWCSVQSVYLTTPALGYAYTWFKGSTLVEGATSQNFTPTSGGTYKVQITDNAGCTKKSSGITITINNNPSPTITPTTATVLCQGSSATLSANTTYNTYLWSTGATTQSINVNTAGNYALTVTDANGCVGTSATKSVVVNPKPVATITAAGATSFCDGGSVTLNSNAFTSYKWSNNKTTQSISATASGTYSVTVTDVNGCKDTSNAIVVTEWILPEPAITLTGPATYCKNTPSTLSTIPGYTYQWKKGTTVQTGETNQTFSPTKTGTYKVTITDSHSCTKTSATGVAVTVNNCKTGDESRIAVASLDMYPNPAMNAINIEAQFSSTEAGEARIEIFNMLGEQVYMEEQYIQDGFFTRHLVFDTRFNSGAYLVLIRFNDETMKKQFLITEP